MLKYKPVSIAIAQLTSVDDFNFNIDQIVKLIVIANSESENKKPEIIFFPENSIYFRINQNEQLPKLSLQSDAVFKLEKISQTTGICLHITSGFFDEGKMWNASILIKPGESAQIIYKKIHLFDIELSGEKSIKESDVFSAGNEISNFSVDYLNIGSSICYDLRFAELYSYHAAVAVDAIVVPSAFLVKTGRAHWEVLLRARAIESQCYVIAPAQSGIHESIQSTGLKRETYGNSMLIDPWGEIIDQKKQGIGLIFGQIDRHKCLDVRQQIPMKNHRKQFKI